MPCHTLNKFLKPLLIASRVFGAFPLNYEMKPSKTLIGWSLSIAVFFIGTNAQMLRETLSSEHVDIAVILFTNRMVLLSTVWAANLYQILNKSDELRLYFERVTRAEQTLTRMEVTVKYDRMCYLYWTLTIVWAGLILFFYALVKGLSLPTNLRGTWMMLCLIVMGLLQYQFCATVIIMRSLLEAVETAITPNRTVKELELLALIHSSVCGAGRRINSVYSLQLFCVQLYYYVVFCSFMWELISSIIKSMKAPELKVEPVLVIYLSYASLSVMHFYMAALYCETAQQSGKNVLKAFYKLMLQTERKNILSNAKLKLLLETNNQLEFTTGGLFTIDFTMVHSVISSTFIFLTIISQITEETDTKMYNGTTSLDGHHV